MHQPPLVQVDVRRNKSKKALFQCNVKFEKNTNCPHLLVNNDKFVIFYLDLCITKNIFANKMFVVFFFYCSSSKDICYIF